MAPVHAEIPIVDLTDGQSIRLMARVAWGTARTHAKWGACSRAVITQLPERSYELLVETRKQHPPLAVAVMGVEHMIESLSNVIDTLSIPNSDS